MNILLANWTWFPSGGDWTYIENVSKLYESNGHHVVPFSMQDDRNFPSAYQKYFISNINYKALNNQKKISAGFKVLSKSIYSNEAKKYLNNLLDEVEIHLAHLNLIHHYITPSILEVLKQRNIPIIWTLHDYTAICPQSTFISNDKICEACKGGKFYNAILKKCKKNSLLPSLAAATENYIHRINGYYNYVDFFICPSIFSYQKYKEFNFFKDKLHHLYHSYEFIETINASSKFSDEKFVLFVGRLEKIKGVHTLLKAMRNHPNIKLKIIGDGTQEEDLKTYTSQNGMNNVDFLGKKDKFEVWNYIKQSSFLVCPSEWYEVLGFTIVEAMLFGKPVIGADIGAIPETVINDETGLLFKVGNDIDLAAKISLLYNNEPLINKLGENAKKHAGNLFNPRKHFEGLKKLIPAL
ncbi:glycosyltransferase family 4 protein [Pedobacter jejuensis]|uniref:Glycosyltransferase family 1 protein n=1 Tax=Pedobacter jejuensis TaxID=1268550 RepID=A0A3N0C4F3_9SPHI|nr:glycosyltransferase family 4 protein [Pedobacter jejuensis]RNL56921.1 glycosyltransferase family 1 protein [Pedobacter jejuensis]